MKKVSLFIHIIHIVFVMFILFAWKLPYKWVWELIIIFIPLLFMYWHKTNGKCWITTIENIINRVENINAESFSQKYIDIIKDAIYKITNFKINISPGKIARFFEYTFPSITWVMCAKNIKNQLKILS